MVGVLKSIPSHWTGTQQNPRVKHWDQASLSWIRELNYENFLKAQLQAKLAVYGLVYTGIVKTSDDGYGSMGQSFILLPGILENQTMFSSVVENLKYRQRNGIIWHVITVFLTFVKSVVSTSFMNIYIWLDLLKRG